MKKRLFDVQEHVVVFVLHLRADKFQNRTKLTNLRTIHLVHNTVLNTTKYYKKL